MSTNLPTYELDPDLVRDTEVPDADWEGGMNLGGSNAPGLAVSTGSYGVTSDQFSLVQDDEPHNSQSIGQTPAPIQVIQGADINDQVALVETAAPVAPDGVIDVVTGAVNKTGQTIPADQWVWGVIPVA
jgi:hypothetical protein